MVSLAYASLSLFVTEGSQSAQGLKQDRDLEAGTEVEECCFLVCSAYIL